MGLELECREEELHLTEWGALCREFLLEYILKTGTERGDGGERKDGLVMVYIFHVLNIQFYTEHKLKGK